MLKYRNQEEHLPKSRHQIIFCENWISESHYLLPSNMIVSWVVENDSIFAWRRCPWTMPKDHDTSQCLAHMVASQIGNIGFLMSVDCWVALSFPPIFFFFQLVIVVCITYYFTSQWGVAIDRCSYKRSSIKSVTVSSSGSKAGIKVAWKWFFEAIYVCCFGDEDAILFLSLTHQPTFIWMFIIEFKSQTLWELEFHLRKLVDVSW